MHGRRPGLGLQSECPQAKMHGSFLTFDLSIKIDQILHALLAVSMPSILLVNTYYAYLLASPSHSH